MGCILDQFNQVLTSQLPIWHKKNNHNNLVYTRLKNLKDPGDPHNVKKLKGESGKKILRRFARYKNNFVVNEIKKLEKELNHSELTQFELESFMNKLNGWDTIFEESDLDTQKILLGDL